jgi:hypothetical protein
LSDVAAFERPRWLRDLLRFLPLKAQFVLSGNVRDLQLCEVRPGSITAVTLGATIAAELRQAGYAHVLGYDPLMGFRIIQSPGEPSEGGRELLAEIGLQPSPEGNCPAGLELFSDVLQRLVTMGGRAPVALLADFASRLVVRNDVLSSPEHQAFTRALVLSHQAKSRPFGTPPRPFFNTAIWVVDKEGDLPDWLVVDNPRVRHIPISKPDHRTRRQLASTLVRSLEGGRDAGEEQIAEALSNLVEQTEGLLLLDLVAITQFGRTEGLNLSRIGDAVRRYKVGVTEDPWASIDRQKIKGGADYLRARVKGQDHAITHVLDIVKRAVTGVGGTRRGGRPRGVAFLAGPTGVGKTELAKSLTSLLFGDDSAYIRFDMSEFSAEHSDQRLIGAPPGYVGYDVGGELTNAIRERPFSVVLFDEIEKAHPRILDKFLQILDDGVLTSGRGDRVYFSEAFIVFTSNLGIYRLDQDGTRVPNVTTADPLSDVQAKVRTEIERYFKTVIARPEILNRIGDNVLVFDFIRPEIASAIFEGMVGGIIADISTTQGIELSLSPDAEIQLATYCISDLSNGGRGIRNKVETHLVNPLARELFDSDARRGDRYLISGVGMGPTGPTKLELRPIANSGGGRS